MGKWNIDVDVKELQKQITEVEKNGGTGDNSIPKGDYTCKCERLEIKSTKDGRPMLSTMFRIVEGKHKKQCVFMNRVLYGTKNDANMIASAVGWLKSLEPSEDITVGFDGYDAFDELVMDIAEDISELTYDITYDPDAFNSISIAGVFED